MRKNLFLAILIGAILLIGAAMWRLSYTPEFRFLTRSEQRARMQAVREILRKPAWRAKRFLPRMIRDKDPVIAGAGLIIITRRHFTELAPDVETFYRETPNVDLRVSALRTLIELRSSQLSMLAKEALKDRELQVRCAGAHAASAAQDFSLVPDIIKMAGDGTNEERRAALEALIEMKAKEGLPFLVEELEDERVLDAGVALDALVRITGKNEGLDTDAWRIAIKEAGKEQD